MKVKANKETYALLFSGGKAIIAEGHQYVSQGKLHDTESGEDSYFIDYVDSRGNCSRGIVDASDFEVVNEED